MSTDEVGSSVDELTSTVEEASSDIVDAIERTNKNTIRKLTEIKNGINEVQYSIKELHSFLNWTHSETTWRLEKNIELLTGIRNILESPRATQANELYEMGIDSFKNKRLPDAKKILLEARELNPVDYRILVTLGHVFVQANNLRKAKECFKAALDYSRTDEYKKDACLLLSRAYRCLGKKENAIDYARKATLVDPSYPTAQYELASCIADIIKNKH
ncbi:MAG: hypothetical protein PHG35_08040 [Dehalococcoidales bacterium]|nr:hypothetical protein [Dehalococcoidales bacterium]